MKKFIVLYHAPTSAMERMADVSPEDAQKGMEPWMRWSAKVGNGMVDMGSPLGNGMKVTNSGATPSDKNVVGYSILQANSMKEALAMVKEHPHLDWVDGCAVEVHETLPLPGM